MSLGIIRKKGNSAMEKIVDIQKIVIECNHCNTEIRFDVKTSIRHKSLYSCPMCGSLYGVDEDNDVILRVQELIKSLEDVKGATFSFLCNEE